MYNMWEDMEKEDLRCFSSVIAAGLIGVLSAGIAMSVVDSDLQQDEVAEKIEKVHEELIELQRDLRDTEDRLETAIEQSSVAYDIGYEDAVYKMGWNAAVDMIADPSLEDIP